jgi:hypothetical protein
MQSHGQHLYAHDEIGVWAGFCPQNSCFPAHAHARTIGNLQISCTAGEVSCSRVHGQVSAVVPMGCGML